jgi:hypothetical protein
MEEGMVYTTTPLRDGKLLCMLTLPGGKVVSCSAPDDLKYEALDLMLHRTGHDMANIEVTQ